MEKVRVEYGVDFVKLYNDDYKPKGDENWEESIIVDWTYVKCACLITVISGKEDTDSKKIAGVYLNKPQLEMLIVVLQKALEDAS